jgi:hypothetical protein
MNAAPQQLYLCRWCESGPSFATQLQLVSHLGSVHKIHQMTILDVPVHEHGEVSPALIQFADYPSLFSATAENTQRLTAGALAGATYIDEQFELFQNTLREFMMRGIRIGIAAALDIISRNNPDEQPSDVKVLKSSASTDDSDTE